MTEHERPLADDLVETFDAPPVDGHAPAGDEEVASDAIPEVDAADEGSELPERLADPLELPFASPESQLHELTQLLGALRESVEGRLDGVKAALSEDRRRSAESSKQLVDALMSSLGSRLVATDSRIDELAVRLASDRAGLTEHLETLMAPVTERLRVVLETVEEAQEQSQRDGMAGRIDEVASSINAVHEEARSIREETAKLGEERALVERGLRNFADAFAQHIGKLQARLTAQVDELLAGRLEGLPLQVADTVGVSLAATTAAIQSELSAVRDVAHRDTARLEASLGTTAREIQEKVETAVETALDALRSSRGETIEQLRADLGATTGSVESVIRIAAEQVRRQADSLAEISSRVAELGDRVGTMTERRGFQKLVESEGRLLQEQSAFVERLEASRRSLDTDVERLEGRLTDFETELESSIRGVRTETIGDLERLRVDLRDSLAGVTRDMVGTVQALREHIDHLAGPRSDIQAVAGEVEAASLALRGEVKALGSEVTELRGGLDEEMRKLDEHLRDRLADIERRVVDSVAQEIDRRFDTIMRLIETGLPQVENILRMTGPPQLPESGG